MNPVITAGQRDWSVAEWTACVADAVMLLQRSRTQVLATVMDNSPAWVALDEAAAQLGVVHVPLPSFFSDAQVLHVLQTAGADTLCIHATRKVSGPGMACSDANVANEPITAVRLAVATDHHKAHPGTAKITFTSGTTGTPKGVCLSAAQMDAVVCGLVDAMKPLHIQRHLSALPYAVLLENVAGVMAARRQGATVICLPLADIGLRGSSDFEPARFDATVRHHTPDSLMVLPQMLKAWVMYLEGTRQAAAPSLKFVAVGGAPLGRQWLERARQRGIPAYEGYGLSEGASVQTLNLPWACRDGSVGRALPSLEVRLAADGEVEVRGSLFLGYLGQPPRATDWWSTGDLGHLDSEGFLTIRGRKKNVLITGFGRNVSPEWVETALQQEPLLPLVVVVGDGDAQLGAVVWTSTSCEPHQIQAAIDRVNATLPDYARVGRWVRADPALRNGFFTANGRPLRPHIESYYRALQAPVAPLALS